MTRLLLCALALAGCHTSTTAVRAPPDPGRPVMLAMPVPRPGLDCAEVRSRAEELRPKELGALAQALEEPDVTDQAAALPALGACTRLAEDAEGVLVDAWARQQLGEDAVVSTSLTGCADRDGAVVEAQVTHEDVTASLIGRLVSGRLEPLATSTWRSRLGDALVHVRGLGDLDGDGARDLLYAEEVVADDGEHLRLWAVLSNGRKLEVSEGLWVGDVAHLVQRGKRALVVVASRDLEQGDGSSLQVWGLRFGVLERDTDVEADLQRRLAPVLQRLRSLSRLQSRQHEHPLEPGDAQVLGPLTPAMESYLAP